MLKVMVFGVLMLLCGGCAGMADVVNALANDKNSFTFDNVNPWSGTTHYTRNACPKPQ
jgi:hypothetical protein